MIDMLFTNAIHASVDNLELRKGLTLSNTGAVITIEYTACRLNRYIG
jgi:hypothetical protein